MSESRSDKEDPQKEVPENTPTHDDLRIELPTSVIEEHLNVTSSLYQPQIDLTKYQSKSPEITSQLERIKTKLARVEKLERERGEALMRKKWEQYEMKRVASISEFKRPLTSAFLLASGVYVSLHAFWIYLEREKMIATQTQTQLALVQQLDDGLRQLHEQGPQESLLRSSSSSINSNKGRWWLFWK